MKSPPLVPDSLWEAIEPLLPKEPPKPKGGRPRVPDRAALAGIVFVLRTGCPWRLLPRDLGCGSGVTCWRRLRDWLGDEAAIDWSRASVDSLSVRAKRGASRPAPVPPTAASQGRNTTWSSTGAASRLPSGSRRPTFTIRPSCFPWSTPSRPSSAPAADKAYDSSALRQALRDRGITLRLARRGVESSERLGRHRWVVERSFAWLLGCRHLGSRYERRADLLQGLLHLACALICVRFLARTG
jgi:transposase